MLNALHNVDHITASRILADVAQDLLPSPEAGHVIDARSSDFKIRMSVLGEARKKVRVNIDDNSPSAKGKLLDFISKEISNIVVPENKSIEAKERLGHAGYLNLALYNITYPEKFSAAYLGYGVRRAHIESAIRSPDHFQHLLTDVALENRSGVTLFTKYHGSDIRENSFVLLVQAHRYKSSLAVVAAWRVYLSDVSLDKALLPIDVLREFLEIYGLDEDWGIAVSKFLFKEIIPFEQLNDYQLKDPTIKLNPYGFCILSSHLDKVRHLLFVSIAYSVDLRKYGLDLKKHGVHLKL